MKEKTFDGLTIRKLKTKDAANFAKISNGLGMAQYLSYFRAKNVSEAENIIVKNNRNGYAMYGLFVRRIGLVSVFYVSPPDSSGGAEISYFTGEDYFGNDYASRGVQLLAQTLSKNISYFTFAIKEENDASLAVQSKLGSKEFSSSTRAYRHFLYNFTRL